MNPEFANMYQCVPYQENDKTEVYEKMVCFYHAKCETYDRCLTDMRSPYDKMSALVIGEAKKYSERYAIMMRKKISEWYIEKYNIPIDAEMWSKANRAVCKMTAQYSIDIRNQLLESGDEIIVELNEAI